MRRKNKARSYDIGQIIGAVIVIGIFAGLVLLAIFSQDDNAFSSSFFDDVARAIQWKQ